MVIDVHTHTFPDAIAGRTLEKLRLAAHTCTFSDGTVGGLAASMKAAGVNCSVILPVATNTRQVPHVNDASARINDQAGETGIYSFGCMHPDFDDWRGELGRIAALGMKGVKLHPVYQNVDIDDIRNLRILDRCGELGLAVLVHAGLDVGIPDQVNCSPVMALHAVRQVGPVRLILAHMGGWRNWSEAEELLPQTSVLLDTSFSLGRMTPLGDGYYGPADLELLGEGQFVRMVRAFGADRILFGTDSPWDSQAGALARLRALPLEPKELDAILGGNALRLLWGKEA